MMRGGVACRRLCQVRVGLTLLVLMLGSGCGPAALLLLSAAGGAAAISGEPQRLYGIQGQDFDEARATRILTGVHTAADVAAIMGNPQAKVFSAAGEEWTYRYFVPPTMFRSGMERTLTVRFRDGKAEDVRYALSAL